ncbi:hypothetical protein Y032_0001g215 [Ancylostoma ceylanicum]|uniref:Uncharacterized protein n=1 Tax=Ancylostoma ceylanicum TaxID=53326 RepID=A0A016W354_9BILA|nr:hypothetical protein Y032_0001g215 [Ancylostoma ceylanicum]
MARAVLDARREDHELSPEDMDLQVMFDAEVIAGDGIDHVRRWLQNIDQTSRPVFLICTKLEIVKLVHFVTFGDLPQSVRTQRTQIPRNVKIIAAKLP